MRARHLVSTRARPRYPERALRLIRERPLGAIRCGPSKVTGRPLDLGRHAVLVEARTGGAGDRRAYAAGPPSSGTRRPDAPLRALVTFPTATPNSRLER